MSTITINNNTDETIRLALYNKLLLSPARGAIAWKVVSPPPGGQASVTLPSNFAVYAEYSMDPNKPDDTQYRTNAIDFAETTARFEINAVISQDKSASGAVVEQVFEDLVINQVQIINNFGIGVRGHITRAGDDIYPPQVIWPGGRLIEDVHTELYLAAIGEFVSAGDRLVQEEVSLTETPILEGQVASVTGSKWKGYAISIE